MAQRTWVDGVPVMAADLNLDLRDQLAFLLTGKPYVSLYSRNITTVFTQNVWVAIPWNNTVADPYNFHTGTSTQIIPTVPGWYHVEAQNSWFINTESGTSTTERRWTSLFKNGLIETLRAERKPMVPASNEVHGGHAWVIYMNGTTDYLELRGRQATTATLHTWHAAEEFDPHIRMIWISD
jgi:hypothetical protein